MFKRKEIKNKAIFYDLLQKYVKQQRTYEILAFMENKTVKSKQFSNYLFVYLHEIFLQFEDHGNDKPIQIFSIKRLYDNKIFTIGDKACGAYITSFYIFGPSLIVGCYMAGSFWLEEI